MYASELITIDVLTASASPTDPLDKRQSKVALSGSGLTPDRVAVGYPAFAALLPH